MSDQDKWAQWILHRRHSGDEKILKEYLDFLYPIRDKVLDNAALTGNETLLDVGCGDGLIAFGALDRWSDGRVIFSDISQDLLDHSQELAGQMNVLDRTEFIAASADSLTPIADESVDVVTLRSVLIYVKDKKSAFEAFYRVLKPGGRLSFFEPINSFYEINKGDEDIFWGYDVAPVKELAAKIRAVYHAIQPPGSDPMLDFDQNTLFQLAKAAGFSQVNLCTETNFETSKSASDEQKNNGWEWLINNVPNPRIPSLKEAMEQVLTPDEIERFVTHLRPLVETIIPPKYHAVAYLWAVK
jgi:arsenite methyltransferase